MTTSPGPATGRTAAGLLLVALSTLMYEVLLTRIFSVTMWYHFAFVAISIAMFGMTVGALLVYLRPSWFPVESTKQQLAVTGVLFPIVLTLSFLTQLSVPFRVHPSLVGVYAIVFTYAVIAAPFVISGVTVCLALTRFPRDTGRLYAFDLVGAALGCLLLVVALALTDGPGAVLLVGALAALGGLLFALDGGSARWRKLGVASFVVLTLAASGHAVSVWYEFPVFRILYVKGAFEARALYEKWNSYSRVRVDGDPERLEKPYAWGLSPTWPEDRLVRQLHMDIDVAAGTVLTRVTGDPRDLEHLKYDVTNIGYYGRAERRGAGGRRGRRTRRPLGARLRREAGGRRRDQRRDRARDQRAASASSRATSTATRGSRSSTTRRAATSRGSSGSSTSSRSRSSTPGPPLPRGRSSSARTRSTPWRRGRSSSPTSATAGC